MQPCHSHKNGSEGFGFGMLVTLKPEVELGAAAAEEAGAPPVEDAVEGVGDSDEDVVEEPEGDRRAGAPDEVGGEVLLLVTAPLCCPFTTGVAGLDGKLEVEVTGPT